MQQLSREGEVHFDLHGPEELVHPPHLAVEALGTEQEGVVGWGHTGCQVHVVPINHAQLGFQLSDRRPQHGHFFVTQLQFSPCLSQHPPFPLESVFLLVQLQSEVVDEPIDASALGLLGTGQSLHLNLQSTCFWHRFGSPVLSPVLGLRYQLVLQPLLLLFQLLILLNQAIIPEIRLLQLGLGLIQLSLDAIMPVDDLANGVVVALVVVDGFLLPPVETHDFYNIQKLNTHASTPSFKTLTDVHTPQNLSMLPSNSPAALEQWVQAVLALAEQCEVEDYEARAIRKIERKKTKMIKKSKENFTPRPSPTPTKVKLAYH